MVPAERTVTVGVGHGKKAARHIDAWLRGTRHTSPPPKHELATFDTLNTWYYADAPRAVQPQLEAARRASTFDEVVGGLDEDNALFEARRCLSCGNCFACDNCYGVCPDNAVIKLGQPGELVRDRPRLLQGLRPVRRRVPVRRDRDGPRADLSSRCDGPVAACQVPTSSIPSPLASPLLACLRRRCRAAMPSKVTWRCPLSGRLTVPTKTGPVGLTPAATTSGCQSLRQDPCR